MESSQIEVVNRNINEYMDYVFIEYTLNGSCPIEQNGFREWFLTEFLPSCITRWYEQSCYDINNMYSANQFFGNSICVFSDILQILTDYFDGYDRIMIMDKFNPKNVMRCYTSVYVCTNVEYFLDRFQNNYYSTINNDDVVINDSNTSDTISVDVFQSTPINVIEDEDDNTTVEDEDDETDSTYMPSLIDNETDNDEEEEEQEDDEDDDELYGVPVSEVEFIEKNKNTDCIICWEVTMNHHNSLRWSNCDHFSCLSCHVDCKINGLKKCPLCRA